MDENNIIRLKIEAANAGDERMIMYHLRKTCGELAEDLRSIIPKEDSDNRAKLMSIYRSLYSIKEGGNPEAALPFARDIRTRNALLEDL